MTKRKHRPLNILAAILLIPLLLCAAFAAGLYGYNRHQLKKESALIRHQGQYIEIGGRNMNLYTAGSGDKTLVFMAGANTPAVIFDFKPLFSRLSDTYRIAVIEKFGYGCSDDADGERNLGTLLRQDREALEKAGLSAPMSFARIPLPDWKPSAGRSFIRTRSKRSSGWTWQCRSSSIYRSAT